MPLADHALVVGIDLYPGMGDLSGAEHDARAFFDWVTSPDGGNVAPRNAKRLLSSDYPVPTNPDLAEPAKRAVEDFFTLVDDVAEANNQAGLGAKAGSRLWLFFAGHGFSPSLDRSGILVANATPRRVHNIAARMWADRLFEGGWFDQVILFQDACRSRIRDADLNPPFLRPRSAVRGTGSGRFYGFAASNDQVAKEIVLPDGAMGGVFTATLLAGLNGGARDPVTDVVSTGQLKDYLERNMRSHLRALDLADEGIAKLPEVFNPDPFDILPARNIPRLTTFPVQVVVSRPGAGAAIEDYAFQSIRSVAAAPAIWTLDLPRGLYRAVVAGVGSQAFQVVGSHDAGGQPIPEVIHV